METDHPLAEASVTGEWIEAFIYVDVSVPELQPSLPTGGRNTPSGG